MKKYCKICKKEVEVSQQKIGGKKDNNTYLDSDDGVYFEDGNCWFCNSCWGDIHKEINIDYKKFL